MAENVQLLDPSRIDANEENPRLIFREDELEALQKSISDQGILVPLTVFSDGRRFTLLDGERRWRCALKLGLPKVPVIIQPKPERLQNIMMMFAIHKTRNDWDPLPTARKLRELEQELEKRTGRVPTIDAVAAAASMLRGEVLRYRRIQKMPERFQRELMKELEKPRSEQILTVDHVLETVKGVEALEKRGVIERSESNKLMDAIVRKFKRQIIKKTVSPRLLPKIARADERRELTRSKTKQVVSRLINDIDYTIDDAYADSAAHIDFEHTAEQLAARLGARLSELVEDGDEIGDELRNALEILSKTISRLL